MKKMYLLKMSFIVFVLLVVYSVSAQAQESNQEKKTGKKTQEEFDVKEKKKDLNIFLDKIEILGHIEKPQTVFILPGSDPNVDDIQIDRSFFKEIFRSIEKDDFPKNKGEGVQYPIIW